jgi:hypothetical protein
MGQLGLVRAPWRQVWNLPMPKGQVPNLRPRPDEPGRSPRWPVAHSRLLPIWMGRGERWVVLAAPSADNGRMRVAFRIFWIGQVWLTAFTVLIAGLPTYRCRCPDGRVKLFCPSFLLGTKGCCCAGACCRTPSSLAQPEREKCCCCRPDSALPTSGADGRVETSGCRRTLAPSGFVGVSATQESAEPGPVAGTLLPAPPVASAPLSPLAEPQRLSWQDSRLPPPTDLVITLQHLVI